MKATTRYAAAFCLSLFSASAAMAADWIARTHEACSVAGDAGSKCDNAVTLVRAAMAAAVPATSGGNGNGNGTSAHHALDEAAAAAVAAYVVLERLYPEQQPEFEMRLAIALADVPESQAKADALARGRRVASEILAAGR
jgi:hypothetical protein